MAQVAHDATRSKTVPHNDQKVITEPRCDHTGTDPRRPMIYSLTGRTATPCSTKATSSSTHTHTYTRLSALCPGLPGWAGKGKTNLDFTEARDSEWQWHQLGHMQVCTSLQTDNHTSTPPLSLYRPDALPAAQPTVSKHINVQCVFSRPTALQLLAQMKKKRWRKRAQRVDESVE